MNEADYALIKMRVHEECTSAAGRRVGGGDLYADNARLSYLIGKDRVSFAESTSQRLVTESGSGRARRGSSPLAAQPLTAAAAAPAAARGR